MRRTRRILQRSGLTADRRPGRHRHPSSAARLSCALGLAASLAVALAACGSPASSSSAGRPRSSASASADPRPGTASVAVAGSLLKLADDVIGPAFSTATGYGHQDTGNGSFALAREIAAGELTPGVFASVGTGPVALLEPRFTSWAVQLAGSPLVIAYNPHGPRAADFARARPDDPASLRRVFDDLARPGFRLGRTDPATDPQGQAFVLMLELAQRTLGLPGDLVDRILGGAVPAGAAGDPAQVFAETSLDATLQAGQLDAASAFLSQAVQLHLPYVALPAAIDLGDPGDAAAYAAASLVLPATAGSSVPTTVHGAPLVVDVTALDIPGASAVDRAAADAYVVYLLSAAGRGAMAHAGYTVLAPIVTGATATAAVPAAVRRAIRAAPA